MDTKTRFKRKPNGMAEDLGAVVGFSNTILICGIWGGKTLYVPEVFSAGHRLAELLGDTAFRQLVAEWGGETGVVGLLKGARPGPVVALRADIDALLLV